MKKLYFGFMLLVLLVFTGCGGSDDVVEETYDDTTESESIVDDVIDQTPEFIQRDFSLSLQVCDDFDDFGNCANEMYSYNVGDSFVMILDVFNLRVDESGFISYLYEQEVYNPDNELIEAVSGQALDINREVGLVNYYDVSPIYNFYTDESDDVGDYRIYVKITDRVSDNVIEESVIITLS